MVGFGQFHNNSFVRLVTINGENTHADIRNFFAIFEEFVFKNEHLIKRR
jgi:hypothetical protein